jgi:H+-transporting ATPase
LIVRHWADFAIILALLIVNAIVGFWEEFQANNTIAALKARLAPEAEARRDGQWQTVPARELVPGDLINLRLGQIVPADARLLDGDPVSVDQSALTGESLPVTAKSGAAVYSGSIITRGEIEALVYATGEHTYFGKTAQLVESAHTKSHFQQAILKIGNYLIVLDLILVILILMVALLRADNFLTALQFALVLTVAAIPVAMPTVLSITMAVGARLLAAKEAIVTRLAAIEELASVDVLCSDKTGTLTQNRLTLGDPYVVEGEESENLLMSAALASRAEDNDPIDMTILRGLTEKDQLDVYRVTHFQPFDPVHKRTEATVSDADGHVFFVTKGAPQVILALASPPNELRQHVEKAVDDFAARGYRALGVARADAAGEWRLLGVLSLYDPPREDSKSTIATAEELGVKVKMVTGDQEAIAKEIASQLGLGDRIIDASVFDSKNQQQASGLADAIEQADGFAQVFPEHKYHIVEVLQQGKHIVAMTGDGVNDAPALKKADAGIAVSGATDAARSAADFVLLTPGLFIIIDALNESRKIFRRMNSYAIYRIAETIRVLLFLTLSILVFDFYPVTPVMIVLLALLNDGAILSIAYDNARSSDKPEVWDISRVVTIATTLGICGLVATFLLFALAEKYFGLPQDTIQSLIYLKLSVAGHLTIFITRTRGPFWTAPHPSRILLGSVVMTQIIATLITVYGIFMAPLGWKWALVVWVYALVWFLINDRVKLLAYRVFDRHRSGLLAPIRNRIHYSH